MKEVRHASQPLIYAVSTIFGVAFSLLLVMLAWQNALEAEKKEFAFDSILLRDTVKLSASAAHNSLDNIAALLEGLDASRIATLPAFLKSLLARHPFIESISFYRSGVPLNHPPKDMVLRPDAGGDPSPAAGPTILWGSDGELYIGRNPAKETLYNDQILSDPRFTDALRAAVDTGMVVPGPPASATEGIRPYTLIKAIGTGSAHGTGVDRRSNALPGAFVAILVNPGHLFSESLLRDDVSVSLYTESQGVTGRQLVFEQRGAVAPENANFSIGAFKAETLAQFPYYSMKLAVERQVLWREIDKGLIATAVVLGIGVTTLIVALARAREIQAWELSRRNQEIERQVSLQTKELAVTRDAAIKASTVKTEFLASMSHEIRTPLNAIIGMGELLSETPLTRVQKRYVGVFKKAGEALLALVNDILDLSKIEAGQLGLEKIPFNLRTLIEETVDIHALRADEKNLELLCHIGTDVPAQVKGDAVRLRQILLNLVGNAIKFTQKGEVVVKVSSTDISDPYRLLFSVEDTGIGIPADKINTVFDSFSQADSSTTRQYGGTGLGLTISKRLVELMGGRIRAESVEGKGSVLSFAISLESVPEPQARIATDASFSFKDVRVLIIDDNSTNRLILREVLSAQGALVSEGHGGAEGIRLFREASRAGQDYAVVITDCHMPEVDGFAVVEALRTGDGSCKTILMVSSSQLSSDMSTASALGIGAYLMKPVKSVELIKAINVAMLKTLDETQDHIVTTPLPERRTENLPILLVEDTPDNRLLVKAYLRKTPYKIEEAENGSVALQKFKTHAYGLVLMDIQMPVMDGHQATRFMREWETEQGRDPTPIIALTAHAVKQEMDKSIAAGCTAHLIKPIKKETLLQIVQKYLPVSPAS